MSSFICPFCSMNRIFVSFHKLFQHITLYHQNEPNFKISCDIDTKCGVLYRTYSAYKSHVYRSHASLLYSMKHLNKCSNSSCTYQQQEDVSLNIAPETIADNENDENENESDESEESTESSLFEDDENEISADESFSSKSSSIDEEGFKSLLNIKRSYISFILQLREEYLVPKHTVNVISTYLISLLHHVRDVIEEKAFSDTSNEKFKKIVDFDDLQSSMQDICNTIEATTRNEYQFLQNCESYFNFSPAEEVVLSSSGEKPQCGYFIPIDKSILSMFKSKTLLCETLENIRQQTWSADRDPDVMFSVRDAHYGNRVDADNLLIQLYLDDIGLTNPLGAKRDLQKMCMIYFSIEDLPDKYRSKLDFIQLVGVCESNVLKVKIPLMYIISD